MGYVSAEWYRGMKRELFSKDTRAPICYVCNAVRFILTSCKLGCITKVYGGIEAPRNERGWS